MKRIFFILALLTGCAASPKTLPVVARAPEDAPTAQTNADSRDKPVVLTDKHILSRLGAPNVMRKEPPAEVWVYTQNACVLYIYLKNPHTESAHVTHMEIGAPTTDDTARDASACLNLAARL